VPEGRRSAALKGRTLPQGSQVRRSKWVSGATRDTRRLYRNTRRAGHRAKYRVLFFDKWVVFVGQTYQRSWFHALEERAMPCGESRTRRPSPVAFRALSMKGRNPAAGRKGTCRSVCRAKATPRGTCCSVHELQFLRFVGFRDVLVQRKARSGSFPSSPLTGRDGAVLASRVNVIEQVVFLTRSVA